MARPVLDQSATNDAAMAIAEIRKPPTITVTVTNTVLPHHMQAFDPPSNDHNVTFRCVALNNYDGPQSGPESCS